MGVSFRHVPIGSDQLGALCSWQGLHHREEPGPSTPGLGGEPSITAPHTAGKPRELPCISEKTGQHQCSSGHSRETPKATAWQKRAPPQPAAPASWTEAELKWKCLEERTPDLGNSPKSLPSVAAFQQPTPSGPLTSLPRITPSCPTHSRFSCVTSNLDPLGDISQTG